MPSFSTLTDAALTEAIRLGLNRVRNEVAGASRAEREEFAQSLLCRGGSCDCCDHFSEGSDNVDRKEMLEALAQFDFDKAVMDTLSDEQLSEILRVASGWQENMADADEQRRDSGAADAAMSAGGLRRHAVAEPIRSMNEARQLVSRFSEGDFERTGSSRVQYLETFARSTPAQRQQMLGDLRRASC